MDDRFSNIFKFNCLIIQNLKFSKETNAQTIYNTNHVKSKKQTIASYFLLYSNILNYIQLIKPHF